MNKHQGEKMEPKNDSTKKECFHSKKLEKELKKLNDILDLPCCGVVNNLDSFRKIGVIVPAYKPKK